MISKIISGHQTGADIGAIDAAISLNLPVGGYVPKDRRTENGTLDARYDYVIPYGEGYPPRTRRNIQESDQTVVFYQRSFGAGTKLTIKICQELGKERYVYDIAKPSEVLDQIIKELALCLTGVVNWAGSRESSSPGIQAKTFGLVREILLRQREIWH